MHRSHSLLFFTFLLLFTANGMVGYAEEAAVGTWQVNAQPNLKELHANAPKLSVETLGTPVKTVTVSGRYFVPNPDGRTYDLLQIYFKRYGGPNTIVRMDLGAGTVKQTQTTNNEYVNFHNAPSVLAPNGKLFLSILVDKMQQQIWMYDPATDTLTPNAVQMPQNFLGETHPMVLGPDGMIYCSGSNSSRSVSALQINPDTLAVTHYGELGPSHAPRPSWAYSMAADDRYIYIASGKTPWYLVSYDRQTGKTEVLLTNEEPEGYLGVNQNHGGASCFSRRRKADGGHVDQNYWLYQGKAIPMVGDKPTPPWPKLPDAPVQPPVPETSFVAVQPDDQGQATVWYRTAADKAKAVANTNTRQAPAVQHKTEASSTLPLDAQLRAAGWRDLRYSVPMYPLVIDRLMELPDGRLLGTAGNYQGNFFYDPKTGQSNHPGQCGLSHYSTVIYDGKVYMSGYPSGPLYVLDPARPWTANKPLNTTSVMSETDPQSNPRRLMYMKQAGAKKMLAAAAGSGKVYFGGVWMREGNWGGLGWMDVQTSQEGGIWKPFAASQIRYMAAADDGRILVISTLPVDNPEQGLTKAADAPLFFFDTRTNTLSSETLAPIPGSRCTGPVVAVGGTRVIGWAENPADPKGSSILYGVDAATRRLLFTKKLPFRIPIDVSGNQWDPWDFRLGPDGKIWTFIENKLARIDPADASIEFLGSTGVGGRMAFADGNLYLGGQENLRCVRGILDKR